MPIDTFNTTPNYSKSLGKPIFVERGIENFAQWILGVLTESRPQVRLLMQPTEPPQMGFQIVDQTRYFDGHNTLQFANKILQAVLSDDTAEFQWASRHQAQKVGVRASGKDVAAGLDALSGGQATLLAIFGAIARYADMARVEHGQVEGIVVIDELDAHMHMELQLTALPKLLSLFPRVQFVMSCHSPFLTLGLEKQFPDGGVRIIELPSGLTKSAETYNEFERALEAFRDTKTFEGEVSSLLSASELPIVLVAGKTDVAYFTAAAKLLGFDDLESLFENVGKDDAQGGTNAGDGNLTNAVHLLQANPTLTRRKVIAVYDCDAKRVAKPDARVAVIKLPFNADRRIKKGIENMLPDGAISPAMYDQKQYDGDYGDDFVKPDFNKPRACEMLTGQNADPSHFGDFRPILEQIRAKLAGPANPADQASAGVS